MTDLFQRLQQESAAWKDATHTFTGPNLSDLLADAAIELARLRRLLSKIKEGVEEDRISGSVHYDDTGFWSLKDFFAFNPIKLEE